MGSSGHTVMYLTAADTHSRDCLWLILAMRLLRSISGVVTAGQSGTVTSELAGQGAPVGHQKLVGGGVPAIAGGSPMEDEKLVRGVHRRQQLKVEPDLAEILMTDRLYLVLWR
jgi:hypothetical protein